VLHEAIYYFLLSRLTLPGPTDDLGNYAPGAYQVSDASFVRYYNGHILSPGILTVDLRLLACYSKHRVFEENGELVLLPDCSYLPSTGEIYLQVLAQWLTPGNYEAPAVATDFLGLP
jgi:hypothetical protein